jgi:predicted S18 family serine protease
MDFRNIAYYPRFWIMATGTIQPDGGVVHIGMTIETVAFSF